MRGYCNCQSVKYKLNHAPLFVHACHCLDCQRESGSAFGLTCIVLQADIQIESGELTAKQLSPRSTAYRCVECRSTIFVTSIHFLKTALLQVSSLNDPRELQIGAHIWVKRKHPWLHLPEDVLQFDKEYDWQQTWPEQSLARVRE